MAETGQLVQWNDARGFGFIETGDGQRHFVHISAIGRIAARPRIGDSVTFVPGIGTDGRPKAKSVRILGANPTPSLDARRRREPVKAASLDWRLPLALVLIALVVAGFALGRIPLALTLAYAGMSLVSLIAYGADKQYAAAGQWRTSEVTLLGLDLCLGIVGGLLGQALFRHKTRKPGYVASAVLIAGVHLLWLGGLVGGLIDANGLVDEMASLLGSGG